MERVDVTCGRGGGVGGSRWDEAILPQCES